MTSIQDYIESIQSSILAIQKHVDVTKPPQDICNRVQLEKIDHLLFNMKDRAISDGRL